MMSSCVKRLVSMTPFKIPAFLTTIKTRGVCSVVRTALSRSSRFTTDQRREENQPGVMASQVVLDNFGQPSCDVV